MRRIFKYREDTLVMYKIFEQLRLKSEKSEKIYKCYMYDKIMPECKACIEANDYNGIFCWDKCEICKKNWRYIHKRIIEYYEIL